MASAHHTGTRALPKRAASPVGLMRARPLLIEPSRAARRALFQITTLPMLSLKPRLALALLLVVGVFTADLFEPADNVSICFAYTLPILLGVYMGPGSTFRLAALATAASLAGSFIRPPEGGIVLSFVVNRVIAVAAQWLVAFLVEQRRRNHALVDARLTEERLVAETGRRFVQILTHEIATALTAIDGQGYRLGKLAQTIEPMDIIARSEKIRHAATRLKGLVERVRLAAEVGRGEILLNREAIEAVPFLEALVAEYEAKLALERQQRDALDGVVKNLDPDLAKGVELQLRVHARHDGDHRCGLQKDPPRAVRRVPAWPGRQPAARPGGWHPDLRYTDPARRRHAARPEAGKKRRLHPDRALRNSGWACEWTV